MTAPIVALPSLLHRSLRGPSIAVALALLGGCAHVRLAGPEETWPAELRAPLLAGDFAGLLTEGDRLEAGGDGVGALLVRAVVAEHQHDAETLRALLQRPEIAALRRTAGLRARLASAIDTTLGLAEAKDDLAAVCAATELSDLVLRANACSRTALAAVDGAATVEGPASIELDLLPKVPLPIVLLSVNGLPPAPFIVDTGAAGTVIAKAYADAHAIKYLADHPRTSHDAGGHAVPLFPTWLDSLGAKELNLTHVEAVVIDLPPNFKIGGILAPHRTYAGALVELDLRLQKLRIQREQPMSGWIGTMNEAVHRVPLAWNDGNIFVHARLGDAVEGFLNFDTGAVGSIVTLPVAERLGHAVRREEAFESLSVTKHAAFPPFQAPLAIGDGMATFEPFTPIERSGTANTFEPLGNVGQSWMKGRRIALSPDGRTLAYTEAAR